MTVSNGAVVLACAAWLGLASSARAFGNEWEQTSAADFAGGTMSNATLIGPSVGTVRLAASAEAWTQIDGPGPGDLFGLHMISNTSARAVGTIRADANNSYNAARYDGSAWSEDATPTQGTLLNTVWMLSEAEGWAMGDPNGNIYYDEAWQDEVAYSTLRVNSIFLSNGGDGWAVGSAGGILRFDGEWNSVDSPAAADLNGVSMVSPEEGWIVGTGGRILRYDGASWNVAASPTGDTLNSVSMLPSGKGWAVGAGGAILRYDGSSWSVADSPTPFTELASVWMVSEDEGWAVGDSGMILRYDGSDWLEVPSPVVDALQAVSFGSPERGLAVGLSGTAVKYERDYFAAGTFVSSVFDRGGAGDWDKLSWEDSGTADGVEVKFQVASAATNPPTTFLGPDGTALTYYTTSGQALWSGHDPDRYIRYKAFFSTNSSVLTPRLKSVTISY